MFKKSLQSGGEEKKTFFSSLRDRSKRNDSMWEILVFLGPMFVIYTLFFTIPLFGGIYYSFTDWDGVRTAVNFIGLDNYRDLFFNDVHFINSLRITFNFTVWNVLLTNIIAMLFAVALTSSFKFNNLFRASIFLPNMIAMVVSGFIWLFMFNRVSQAFYASTGIEFLNRSWLGNPDYVIGSIVLVSLWQGIGYIMTIYIAGLQGVDDSLIEAASIDGSNGWNTFWRIKMPIMLPTITVGAFINIAGSLRIFDTVMSLTAGGPGRASEMAMINIYREAFVNNNMGYGAAKATVLSVLIIVVAIMQFRFTSKKEVDF